MGANSACLVLLLTGQGVHLTQRLIGILYHIYYCIDKIMLVGYM